MLFGANSILKCHTGAWKTFYTYHSNGSDRNMNYEPAAYIRGLKNTTGFYARTFYRVLNALIFHAAAEGEWRYQHLYYLFIV